MSETRTVTFDDVRWLRDLFGVEDRHLRVLEQSLGIAVSARGDQILLRGDAEPIRLGEQVLRTLYDLLARGTVLDADAVSQTLRTLTAQPTVDVRTLVADVVQVPNRRRQITPRTPGQKAYLDAIRRFDMVFGIGPAGTGKTYLAMAMAVESLLKRRHERIILCRPAVEAGEKLGFLPGSMQEKVNPYLRPLYDALHDMMEHEQAQHLIEEGTIEVAPLAFMRGRTLAHSFVILDEGQNCTPEQMKMFLTRMGEASKVVITGDITQIDLPNGVASGLIEAVRILSEVPAICVHYLTEVDVVRHPLVQAIVLAYEAKGGGGI
ncbi:MAG: PhoH family protein [Deltaproteobacteria bacterium]|nr:PhoH family protein [Deltaproteobacteria bacterium]